MRVCLIYRIEKRDGYGGSGTVYCAIMELSFFPFSPLTVLLYVCYNRFFKPLFSSSRWRKDASLGIIELYMQYPTRSFNFLHPNVRHPCSPTFLTFIFFPIFFTSFPFLPIPAPSSLSVLPHKNLADLIRRGNERTEVGIRLDGSRVGCTGKYRIRERVGKWVGVSSLMYRYLWRLEGSWFLDRARGVRGNPYCFQFSPRSHSAEDISPTSSLVS